jgi:streptogramin lyase
MGFFDWLFEGMGPRRRGRGSKARRQWSTPVCVDRLEDRTVPSVVINEFALGDGGNPLPCDIAAGSDGNLWFVEHNGNRIGVINSTTRAVGEFAIPTAGGDPTAIASGPDGNMWFTEFFGDKVGMINPTTHAITEFPVPAPFTGPTSISVGPDGNIWFGTGGSVGYINPTTYAISQFLVSNYAPWVHGITAGQDGNLWFTEFNASRVGVINPTTHEIRDFATPGVTPIGIAEGPDGNIWFTEMSAGRIAQMNPSTHAINEFSVPGSDSLPVGITAGPDGNLWFTDLRTGKIGQINPTTHAISEFVPSTNGQPSGITVGPDGNLWFTEQSADKIGEVVLAGPSLPTLTSLSQNSAAEGSNSISLSVNGSNFQTGAKVDWNGAALSTTSVSSSRLLATIPFADLAEEGSANITVVNPTGSTSNLVAFTVADLSVLAIGNFVVRATPGRDSGTQTVATFTDPAGAESLAIDPFPPFQINYSASINWGDNFTSTGAITFDSNARVFTVTGDHSYARANTFTITVTIHHDSAPDAITTSTALVTATPTVTTLTSSLNPSNFGQALSFTAGVSSGAGTPTGTVTFTDGPTTLGSASLNASGQATFTPAALSVGTHTITAIYGGDASFQTSQSAALTQTVNAAAANATSTALVSSLNPSHDGQSIVFTATVTPLSPTSLTPTGTVTFKDGTAVLGNVTLNSQAKALFTTSTLGEGNHSITAVYTGDSNWSGSASPVVVQTVQPNLLVVLPANIKPMPAGGAGQPSTIVGISPPNTDTGTDSAVSAPLTMMELKPLDQFFASFAREKEEVRFLAGSRLSDVVERALWNLK